jgi:hypothetical protein
VAARVSGQGRGEIRANENAVLMDRRSKPAGFIAPGAGCIGTSFAIRCRISAPTLSAQATRTIGCADASLSRPCSAMTLCRPSTDISGVCCTVVSCGCRVYFCRIQGRPSCGTSGISPAGSGASNSICHMRGNHSSRASVRSLLVLSLLGAVAGMWQPARRTAALAQVRASA